MEGRDTGYSQSKVPVYEADNYLWW